MSPKSSGPKFEMLRFLFGLATFGGTRVQEVLKMAPKKKKASDELRIKVRQLTRVPMADDDRSPPDYRLSQ